MKLDGAPRRALAKVVAAQCFRDKLKISDTLAQATQGAQPHVSVYAYLEGKGLIEWLPGKGYHVTDAGEAELRAAGIDVP